MAYETTLQDSPVCPHCGHEHTDAFEWNFGPCLDGSIKGRECDSCGEAFDCDLVVTVEYTTKKPSAAQEGKSHG